MTQSLFSVDPGLNAYITYVWLYDAAEGGTFSRHYRVEPGGVWVDITEEMSDE